MIQNRFVHVNKKLMINVYEKNDLEPDPKADTDIFYDLLQHIIPHEVKELFFRLVCISQYKILV